MLITKKYLNDLMYEVIGCAIEVHKQLCPGLLEGLALCGILCSYMPMCSMSYCGSQVRGEILRVAKSPV